MNKLNVFIKDTFIKNIKSISFITMLLTPIIVVGIIIGIIYFVDHSFSGFPDTNIAVISNDPAIAVALEQTEESIHVEKEITTEEEARSKMADEAIDAYLVAEWTNDELNASMTYSGSMETQIPIIEQVLSSLQMMARAQELNVSPEQVQSLNEPVELQTNVVSIDAGQVIEEDGLANAIAIGSAYFINIMIMMFIMFYASTVIEEVAGEKGTRMMEVILSSTTATTHFFGKLIGVFLVMLLHVSLYILIITGAYFFFRNHEFVVNLLGEMDVAAVVLEFLQFSSIFLLVGVLMYMFIAAFLGSLITKTEDISRAATPLTMIVLLGFYIGLFAMIQPENSVVVISSYIPFLTPFVMPFRIATNTVSSLQIGLSIGGSILFTAFVAFISLIFYRANVLIYSDTSLLKTIKQSWSLIRNERATI